MYWGAAPPEAAGLAASGDLLLALNGSWAGMKLYGLNDPPPVAVGVPLSSGEVKLTCPPLGLEPGKLKAYSSRGAYTGFQALPDGSPSPGTWW